MIGLSVVNSASKSRSVSPCGCSLGGCSVIRSTTLITRTLRSGSVLAQQIDGGERFERRHVAAAGHHHVGLAALVVAGPFPDADARRAVLDRLVHGQPLRRGLFAGDDDVDVVAALQAMVGDRKQAIGVRRQIDANDLGLLVGHVVDEAGILMAEAVVVLPPDMRTRGSSARRSAAATGCRCTTFSHLACWLNIESMMWMNAS